MQGALTGSYFHKAQSTRFSSTGTCPLLHRNAFRTNEETPIPVSQIYVPHTTYAQLQIKKVEINSGCPS